MKKTGKQICGLFLVLALVLQIVPAGIPLQKAEAAEAVTVAAPAFSKESGNYDAAFNLTLTAGAGTTIYYSTDGSVPSPERKAEGNAQIYQYQNPISVKDRTGEKNVLATPENAKKMTQTKQYTATDAQVAKSTVIRAMAVDAEGNESPVVTKTYFVGKNKTTRYENTAVLSLVTDPKNLMDNEIGIFVTGNHDNYNQHGREWEREAYADFYEESGKIGFGYDIGIRVHGGYTRQYQQKSMNVYFREEYGQKNLKYELIPGATNYEGTEATKKYKNFVLRNGGNDTLVSKTRDVFIQSRVADRNISTQAHRPCIVYLNGEYWGLYNIQEKYGDNWLEEEFGVNKDNVVIIKDGEVDEGQDSDLALYEDLKKLSSLDMSKEENYQKFLDAVELQSYLDYYATEVLIGNEDWGQDKNNQLWRSREVVPGSKYEDGKWRWLLHDTEYSMSLYSGDLQAYLNLDTIADMKGSGFMSKGKDPLFAALLANSQFKQAFANTVMDLLNENFNYEKYNADYTEFKSLYEALMPEQNKRFGTDWCQSSTEIDEKCMQCFNSSVSNFMNLWKNMASRMDTILKKHLSVKNKASVSVSTSLQQEADLTINTLKEKVSNSSPWTGEYWREVPVRVAAPEVSGYTFSGWEVTGGTVADAKAQETQITLSANSASIKALYEEKPAEKPSATPATTAKPTATPSAAPAATVKPAETPSAAPAVTAKPTGKPSVTPDPKKTPNPAKKIKAPKRAVIQKVTSPKKKTIKVKIKKLSADGFEIIYARNKKFTKSKKKKKTVKRTVTIKKLKRKTKYYIKVRAYRKGADGKKVYGKFSKIKRIRVK